MPAFAVYYVPPAESPLYQAGSSILGYDLRTGALLPVENPTRSAFATHLAPYPLAWLNAPQQYGFHMTISPALEFELDRLPAIEQEIDSLLNSFEPSTSWELTPCTEWIDIAGYVGLRYDPNLPLVMLHTLVTALINPLATTSPNLRRFEAGETHGLSRAQEHRLRRYYYRYVLEEWFPHFTLFNEITLSETVTPEQIRAGVLAAMPTPQPLTVESLALLIKDDGARHYRLHREFMRRDYPQAYAQDKA